MPPQLEVICISQLVEYSAMMDRLRARQRAVEGRAAPNTLFLLEHTPVITFGRNGRREHILADAEGLAAEGIAVIETDRGGDVTYHGPGQLIAYPVLDLSQWRCSVGWYLRTLEEVLIRLLTEYGLQGERLPGYPGVWISGAKVAAIGISIHRWVTSHGIAFNVRPNLDHFRLIIPCGIGDKPVTSLERLLGRAPAMAEVMNRFEGRFREVFLHAEGRSR